MSDANGKCDDCGRFMKVLGEPAATWAEQYDFVEMCCSYVHFRCPACTTRMGAAVSNARPSDGDMRSFQGTCA